MGRRAHSSLAVARESVADRILFEGNVRSGVMARSRGRTLTLWCSGKVVVCAGATASQQLLMLSGLGDGDALWGSASPRSSTLLLLENLKSAASDGTIAPSCART